MAGFLQNIPFGHALTGYWFCNLAFLNYGRTARDGHGGCNNDGFAVFGFLAFLLAAANLLMDDGGRGFKKRYLLFISSVRPNYLFGLYFGSVCFLGLPMNVFHPCRPEKRVS